MPMGMEGMPAMHWSKEHLRLAIAKVQNQPPTYGLEGDTGERDGKYYAMGYELEKPEYDHFMQELKHAYEVLGSHKGSDERGAV